MTAPASTVRPPLATPDDLAGYLQRTPDPAAADLALTGASGAVRAFCRWDIDYQPAAVFIVDGTGTTVLNLPTLRLVDVTSVRINGITAGPVDGYEWTERGQLRRPGRHPWPNRMRSVEVACAHGYDPIPDEVRQVVLALSARILGNPDALTAKVVGSVQRNFGGTGQPELSGGEQAMLGGYRLP